MCLATLQSKVITDGPICVKLEERVLDQLKSMTRSSQNYLMLNLLITVLCRSLFHVAQTSHWAIRHSAVGLAYRDTPCPREKLHMTMTHKDEPGQRNKDAFAPGSFLVGCDSVAQRHSSRLISRIVGATQVPLLS